MAFGRRAGVPALVLALVLCALAAFAVYVGVLPFMSPDVVGPAGRWADADATYLVTLAAVSSLAALLALVLAAGFILGEGARRRRSERRLSRFLQGADQTEALVTIINRKGRIEYANRAAELTTGYDERELSRPSGTRWFPWYADEKTAEEARAQLLAGGSFRGLVRCHRKDGTSFLLREKVTPLREGKTPPARFVSTAHDVTRQKQDEERLAFLTSFDPLTGLPNRAHFTELVREALGPGPCERRLALMVLDVDRFKYINDLSATGVGDAVLRRTAEILRSVAGSRGFAGRLGSDEFGVVYPLSSGGDVYEIAHSVRSALTRPAGADAQDPTITVALGVACSPGDGTDAASLLKNADLALARAKSLGRDTVQLYDAEMSVLAIEQYAMQRRLAGAFRNGEYQVHYQPYCDLVSGKVSGAEALMRWDSEELGSVPPTKFIPALEDSGLIVTVGEWVLRTACRQIRDWQRMRRGLPVAVNLSQLQLDQHDLVGMISGAVKEHAIDPRQLTLELTESICVRDIDFAIGLLRELKTVGVSISVDDFGTGYSSLSYVKKLPVDNLKIDQSFVKDVATDPDATAIITAITTMARGLGLKTIAEGVENAEQRNILRLLRCDLGQGYLFGQAVAADAFEQMIA